MKLVRFRKEGKIAYYVLDDEHIAHLLDEGFRHVEELLRFMYLFLFMGQVAVYSFHELAEAGLLPNSTLLHDATEPFSPSGQYGKWFSVLMISGCIVWLAGTWIVDRHNRQAADSNGRNDTHALQPERRLN